METHDIMDSRRDDDHILRQSACPLGAFSSPQDAPASAGSIILIFRDREFLTMELYSSSTFLKMGLASDDWIFMLGVYREFEGPATCECRGVLWGAFSS